jgi:manganese/zinc/iron transport system permease protein
MTFDYGLDLFPLLAAAFASLTCALLGNFLVLRRQSLMGDALSHAVLPGIVVAFLVTSSRNPLLMLGGATIAGLVTVVLIELIKRIGRVEPGAAMGVVFSVMFALGVVLIEKAAASSVDLDAECVLYGQLETLVWFGAPTRFTDLWSWETVHAIPRQLILLVTIFMLAVLFVGLLFKELRIAAFDPEMATSQGISARAMHYLLMIFVAAATVASFEAVGSILVVALLIAPAAAARLLTDRLGWQIIVSLIAALICGIGGYFAATAIPAAVGADSVNAAGSIAVVAGLLVVSAALFSPSHGVIAKGVRRRQLGREATLDDLLATLFRREETPRAEPDTFAPGAAQLATAKELVNQTSAGLQLTSAGRQRAQTVLRKHRLWEDYLVAEAGIRADHVHETAEQLEHLGIQPDTDATTDPHGRPIPPPPDEPTNGSRG